MKITLVLVALAIASPAFACDRYTIGDCDVVDALKAQTEALEAIAEAQRRIAVDESFRAANAPFACGGLRGQAGQC
jgi:hypothetical protein